MHIEEVDICGHTIFRPTCETCEKCGEEMTNVMMYGEVCVNCDFPSKHQEK